MNPDKGQVQALMEAIDSYLEAHPEAADTVEGVTTWWLAGLGSGLPRSSISMALAELEARGRIRTTRLASGALIYSRVAPGSKRG